MEYLPKINFTTTAKANDAISLFETNIRYLGGLLSGSFPLKADSMSSSNVLFHVLTLLNLIAHDLLSQGEYSRLVKDKKLIKNVLKQAKSLADSLKFAFDTPSGVPEPTLYLNPAPRRQGSTQNNIAEVGTLVLEWTRLSDLTGDPTYAKLVKKAQGYMVKPSPASSEPFPGLVGSYLSIADGTFVDNAGGWSGGTDSFYEYLIKMYLYDPKEFSSYKDRWVAAADSTIKYLASHPTSRKELTFLSQYQGTTTIPSSSHCKTIPPKQSPPLCIPFRFPCSCSLESKKKKETDKKFCSG